MFFSWWLRSWMWCHSHYSTPFFALKFTRVTSQIFEEILERIFLISLVVRIFFVWSLHTFLKESLENRRHTKLEKRYKFHFAVLCKSTHLHSFIFWVYLLQSGWDSAGWCQLRAKKKSFDSWKYCIYSNTLSPSGVWLFETAAGFSWLCNTSFCCSVRDLIACLSDLTQSHESFCRFQRTIVSTLHCIHTWMLQIKT